MIQDQFSTASLEFHRKLEEKKGKVGATNDLGSEFNDFRLNLRVVDAKGIEKDAYTSCLVEGTLQFKCEVCDISVFGKRNIESHMEGRRHKGNLINFRVIGKSIKD